MPQTIVVFYRESDGTVPVLEWLNQLLKKGHRKAWAKCRERIRQLGEFGFELRRPLADVLRDGIHELRAKDGRVNYRLLYFFHRKNEAILVHGLTKEREVPNSDIERAIRRKLAFEHNPQTHSYTEDDGDGQNEGRSQDFGPQDCRRQ